MLCLRYPDVLNFSCINWSRLIREMTAAGYSTICVLTVVSSARVPADLGSVINLLLLLLGSACSPIGHLNDLTDAAKLNCGLSCVLITYSSPAASRGFVSDAPGIKIQLCPGAKQRPASNTGKGILIEAGIYPCAH